MFYKTSNTPDNVTFSLQLNHLVTLIFSKKNHYHSHPRSSSANILGTGPPGNEELIPGKLLLGTSQNIVDIHLLGNEGNIPGNHLPGNAQNSVDIHSLGNEGDILRSHLPGTSRCSCHICLLGNDQRSDTWRMSSAVHR